VTTPRAKLSASVIEHGPKAFLPDVIIAACGPAPPPP
jgi:hypothetical protein